MKFFIILLICVSLLFVSCSQPEREQPVPTKIVWIAPGKIKRPDTNTVFDQANAVINKQLENIKVEFIIVNKYQYLDTMNLLLSTGEPVDIAWGSDSHTPYLFEVGNRFKILSDVIDKYGQDIKQAFSKERWENLKIFNRIYFLPGICEPQGMIPFLKIPKELIEYIDLEKLQWSLKESEVLTENVMELLSEYMRRLAAADLSGSMADVSTLMSALSLKGYETLLSLSNMCGYRMGDADYKIIDLTSTPEAELVRRYFEQWSQSGYIRNDTQLTQQKNLYRNNDYVLEAMWGYFDDKGLHSLLDDDITNDFIYIPIDNKYHYTKPVTESIVFIPKNSKNPDKSIQVLNLFYKDPMLYRMLTYGIEGRNYILRKDGTAEFLTPNTYSMYPNVFPRPAGADFPINADSVMGNDYLDLPARLINFMPTVSDMKNEINTTLREYNENPNVKLSEVAEMQTILLHLQQQVDEHLERF